MLMCFYQLRAPTSTLVQELTTHYWYVYACTVHVVAILLFFSVLCYHLLCLMAHIFNAANICILFNCWGYCACHTKWTYIVHIAQNDFKTKIIIWFMFIWVQNRWFNVSGNCSIFNRKNWFKSEWLRCQQ